MNKAAARALILKLVVDHFDCMGCALPAGTPCNSGNVSCCHERQRDSKVWACDLACEICGTLDGDRSPMGCDDETHVHSICWRCAEAKTLRVTGRLEKLRTCPLKMTDADRAMAALAREQ